MGDFAEIILLIQSSVLWFGLAGLAFLGLIAVSRFQIRIVNHVWQQARRLGLVSLTVAGLLMCVFTLHGGSKNTNGVTRTATADFRCIEPLRKLVTTERTGDNRFINPSRLVYGTNAVLRVGVSPSGLFAENEVCWSIVSGHGRITSPTNGWNVTVEATATNGEVVIEARFNDDEIQPRFVLPIVSRRVIPIRAFVVEPTGRKDDNAWSDQQIIDAIEASNVIFSQVGVRFELLGEITHGLPSEYWSVRRCAETTNDLGLVSKSLSPEARRLCDYYQSSSQYISNDCIEVYFTGVIANDTAIAFQTEFGIVISQRYGNNTLAHELGHALGLSDCYHSFKRVIIGDQYYIARVPRVFKPVDKEFFCSGVRDWGCESAHGFYSTGDKRWTTMENFLMFGCDSPFAKDIPDGRVLSIHGYGDSPGETIDASIGVEHIRTTNEEVYTK